MSSNSNSEDQQTQQVSLRKTWMRNPLFYKCELERSPPEYLVLSFTACAFIMGNMVLNNFNGPLVDRVKLFIERRAERLNSIADPKARRAEEIFCNKELRLAHYVDKLRECGFEAELRHPWVIDWLRMHSVLYVYDKSIFSERAWAHREKVLRTNMSGLRCILQSWKAIRGRDFSSFVTEIRAQNANCIPIGVYNYIHYELGQFTGEQFLQIKQSDAALQVLGEYPYY